MATNIINPRIYTKDSFYYHFVWDWENNEDIDLTQQYEVLVYARQNEVLQPCNLNNLLTVTYNQSISALDIEKKCSGSHFLIPDNCNCQFKIRKKENNPDDWDSDTLPLFPDSNYSLMPVPLNCAVAESSTNQGEIYHFSVGEEFKNYINLTDNKISQYLISPMEENTSNFNYPSLNCYLQPFSYLTEFQFNFYYNSNLKLNKTYLTPVFYKREETETNKIDDEQRITSLTEEVVDRYEIILSKDTDDHVHNLPNENGALVYIKSGSGWKINQITVNANISYKFSNCGVLTFDNSSATSDLKGYFFTAPFEQTNDLKRNITIKTGNKYAEQHESAADLQSLDIVSIGQNSYMYKYIRQNEHTPVFIYQKVITLQGAEYKLTNDINYLDNDIIYGTIQFNSSSDTGVLAATTSPVMMLENDEYVLKTEHITQEEIDKVAIYFKDILGNTTKVFNSLKENFQWDNFSIESFNGYPSLKIIGRKTNVSNLYNYKIKIVNKMTNKSFLNKEINFVNYNDLWVLEEDGIYYTPDHSPYSLKEIINNELSSKEKYCIQVIREYNHDKVVLYEEELVYNSNSDFFLTPFNNINYNPGEENNFYFSTVRSNSTNEWQGYPWTIYNNKDSVSYFCYSNQACDNNGENSNIKNYDKSITDNTQLVCINYHDKPNFTQKELIPMLDFKITELVKDNIETYGTFENLATNISNVTIDSNNNRIQTNIDEEGSFDLKLENSYGGTIENTEGVISIPDLNWMPFTENDSYLEILDVENQKQLYYYAENNANSDISFSMKKVTPGAKLHFNIKNGKLDSLSSYLKIQTLTKPDELHSSLKRRKFYIDNFSVNEIDYSEIENGSVISGQILQLHKPITLYIEDFNNIPNESIYYKIEKVDEYNQEVITPIDDNNTITLVQNYNNDNMFTKDFYINSHTNQLKIQNTKTKQITFNNAQKDTIVNCILEKEEVED